MNDQTADNDGLQFEFGPVGGSHAVHQQLAVAGSDATANAVVAYGSENRVDEARLKSSLGTEAETVDFVTNGSRVEIEAEYGGGFARE